MKHYIRLDESNYIIKLFSDAFEAAIEGDVLLRESDQRHVYLGDFEFNPSIHNEKGQPKFKFENGEVVESAKPLSNEQKLVPIRAQRNVLLAATDFTQLVDAPFTVEQKAEIAAYRQALRDLPESVGLDLDNPVYPTKPSCLG